MIYLPKSIPAPGCLETEKRKANGTYNCGDVLLRLQEDFKNKCYVCENKEPHSINTEHFMPHRNNVDLKFDWNNLFYCCGHCNNTKLARPIFDHILNCTNKDDGVDTKIKYVINPYPKEKAQITALEDTIQVNNTVVLLTEVYNGTTLLKQLESSNLRSTLLKEIRIFQGLLIEYDNSRYEPEERNKTKQLIVRELKTTSAFTAFKRWIIRTNEFFCEEFKEYI